MPNKPIRNVDSSNKAGSKYNITDLSDPAKLLHDFCKQKDLCDKSERPKILDDLLATMSYSRIDIEEFHKIIDQILTDDSTTNEENLKKIQQIADGIKVLKEREMLTHLSKKTGEALPKVEITLQKTSEKYCKIQSEIQEFKYKELPEGISKMKAARDIKFLFSEAILCTPYDLIERCIELSNERIVMLKQIDKFKLSIDYLLSYSKNVKNQSENGSKSSNSEIKHKKKTASNKKAHLDKVCIEPKKDTCRLEHNTPFCKNCGLRISWLKNFKKRGIYVKETDDSNNKDIWCNTVYTD